MLLTDGESTNREQIVPNLKAYRAQKESLPTINTFGFGYNLDSKLLVELAKVGSGSYSFIPDAGFVGTAFVNSAANLLSTMAVEVTLTIDTEDVGTLDKLLGGHVLEQSGEFLTCDLGTLQYGQTKDLVAVMKMNKEADIHVGLTYKTRHGKDHHPGQKDFAQKVGPNMAFDEDVATQHCRCLYVDAVGKVMETMYAQKNDEGLTNARKAVNEAIEKIRKQGSAAENTAVKALLQDAEGQTTEALTKMEYYNKWGIHYLPSIRNAHELQQCNNFKDPGVQVYGGTVFQDVQEKADDIFNSLEAPKPRARPSWGGGYGGGSAPAAAVDMSAYNNRYAG
jgi:NACalpha-BTF3-like transcription factor